MKNPKVFLCSLSKGNLLLGLKIATIVAATIAIFHQDLTIILNDALQNESQSHILMIPFLFAYLLFRKRKMLRAVIPYENYNQPKRMRWLPTIAGILLSTTAILLYRYGSQTFTPLEYHMFTLPIFAIGLTLIFFNTKTIRELSFPIAFLIFLMPPPTEILYSLGSVLSVASSQVSYRLISFLGIPSTLTNEYGNPIIQITRSNGSTISFAVDIACSGIYSLISFLIFAVFIAYVIRVKPWKGRLAIFLIGFSLVYALNITRITAILIIGYHYGEETALELFHMLGGWVLIFIGTFLLLVITEKVLHAQIFVKPTQKCVACNLKPSKDQRFCLSCGKILKPAPFRFCRTEIVKITAVIVTIILLISIQTPVFALTEGPAQIIITTSAGEQGNIELLPQIQGYTLEFIYRDKNYERMSRQDASLLYAYFPMDENKESVWVVVEIGSAVSMLHRWEFCLISWPVSIGEPAAVIRLDLKDVQILQNPPIIARYFAFQWVETNQTQVVLYWYENTIFMTDSTAQEKRVKISLITYPDNPQNITQVDELLPFATAIAKLWQPIKMWSQIALLLSQHSLSLAMITSSLIAAVMVLYFVESGKQRKANTNAYQKLSKPIRQIVDAITQVEKTEPTLGAIVSAYRSITGESIKEEELLQRLSDTEKTGIIKRDITNRQDQPIQTWKTQINTPNKTSQK
jgi:exosortase